MRRKKYFSFFHQRKEQKLHVHGIRTNKFQWKNRRWRKQFIKKKLIDEKLQRPKFRIYFGENTKPNQKKIDIELLMMINIRSMKNSLCLVFFLSVYRFEFRQKFTHLKYEKYRTNGRPLEYG